MGFWGPGDTASTMVALTDADGAASDADALPTGTVYVDGVANAAVVTMTPVKTGLYRADWTNPGAWGDVLSVLVEFDMGGISSHAVVWEARLAETPPSASDIATAVENALDIPTASEIAADVVAELDIPTASENAQAVITAYVGLDVESNADGSQQTIKDGAGNVLDIYQAD